MGDYNRDRRDFGPRRFDRGGDRGGDRQMFKSTCSNCGNECELPFRPTTGKPVYCSSCFEKMGGRRSDSSRSERSDYRAPSTDQNKAQFEALNVKLDKILRLLEPKVVTEVSTPVTQEPEKVKAVAKKTSSKK